jgi:TRAP-type mannitol/chloroaromatic compound transport system substrate-binding protein
MPAKFYYTTGWHEPNNVTELIINKDAWASLPDDLQEIVRTAAAACNVLSHTWCEATNAEALDELVAKDGVTAGPLPEAVVAKLREVTDQTLTELAASDAAIAKVHESFKAFKAKHDKWAGVSEAVFQQQIRA